MMKTLLIALLPFLVFLDSGSNLLLSGLKQKAPAGDTGTVEKLIVASGNVALDINMNQLNGTGVPVKDAGTLNFNVEPDSFLTAMAFNGELRAILPGSMAIIPQEQAVLPSKLGTSYQQLVVEATAFGSNYELVVRDGKSGFVFFNIEGHEYIYEPTTHSLSIQGGRLLISKEFAEDMGRPSDSGLVVGQFSAAAAMRPIQVTKVTDGEVTSDVLPALNSPENGTVPGPDVVVGDLNGLAQFGSNGTQVGLAVGTDSCNFGTENLNWNALPANDHPVIPQNLYRMSGGAANDERFEQIGQSNLKHAFLALTENICNLGCNGVGGTRLGSGCSDPYVANLNADRNGLGSRAWVNPFTGAFPRGDSATPPNNHAPHTHTVQYVQQRLLPAVHRYVC